MGESTHADACRVAMRLFPAYPGEDEETSSGRHDKSA